MKRYLKTPEEVIQALKEGKTIKSEHGYAYELKDNFIIQTLLGKIRSINTTIFLMNITTLMNPNRSNWKSVSFIRLGMVEKRGLLRVRRMIHFFPFRVAAQKESAVYTVTKEGKRFSEGMSGSDLVAPWED